MPRTAAPAAGGRDDSTATRGALLAAARTEFVTKGYNVASTRDILRRVGVTPPVLYYHLESKAGLYLAVAAAVMDEIIVEFSSRADAADTWPLVLDAACRRQFRPRPRADRTRRVLLTLVFGLARYAAFLPPRAFTKLAADVRATVPTDLA